MKLFFACFIFVVFFATSAFGQIHAVTYQDLPEVTGGQIDEALLKTVPLRFLPSSPLYFVISIKESFSRFFKPSTIRKAEFDFVLSSKRLKEAYLLLEKNDVKNSSIAVSKYGQRAQTVASELEKAKVQNQDVATAAGTIDSGLAYQLILISAIEKKGGSEGNNYNFSDNFSAAVAGFSQIVGAVDQINPGVRDKYLPN